MYQTVYIFTCTQTAARAIYQLSSTIKKRRKIVHTANVHMVKGRNHRLPMQLTFKKLLRN